MSLQNQHFVPKFLLKNFADIDGRVFCLDIHKRNVLKRPPKHLASAYRFNEFKFANQNFSHEEQLAKIETWAAPILRKMTGLEPGIVQNQIERGKVADFLAAQTFRTEAFRIGLDVKKDEDHLGKTLISLLQSVPMASDEIAKRHWVLMEIQHNDVFYLGDHPVVFQVTEEPGSSSDVGLWMEGVEIFFPITPKFALWMPHPSTSNEIVSGYQNGLKLHRQMCSDVILGQERTRLRSEELHEAQRILSRVQPIYQSITTGVPFACDPENVENLNYLQCAWASSSLFCNRQDFSLAEKVFSQSPQYISPKKVDVIPITDLSHQIIGTDNSNHQMKQCPNL
jgi:hypothetical protein